MRRALAASLAVLVALSPLPSLAAAPDRETKAELTLGNKAGEEKLVAGDALSLNMIPGEEYSREVTVQPDGSVQLALLGSVMVAGMTVSQVVRQLEKRYARFVDNPQITIAVKGFSGRRVAIIGEIAKPGFYDYRDGMRMLELVAVAGGFTVDARTARIKILRGNDRSMSVNFDKVLDGDVSTDPALAPGDTINVPKKKFTEGASWVNRNITPWALVVSLIVSVIVASRGR